MSQQLNGPIFYPAPKGRCFGVLLYLLLLLRKKKVALIQSISGFRGTIGGAPGEGLTPVDIVGSAAAFGSLLLENHPRPRVVIGRDGRISGPVVQGLVLQTLLAMGIDVVDAGLSTTPAIELAVKWEKAQGGIIITASHNPREWNALKFLNSEGEFISPETGEAVLEKLRTGDFRFAPVDALGHCTQENGYLQRHVDAVLAHPMVNIGAIRSRKFRVVLDAVNSTGAMALSPLLEALDCTTILLNSMPTGDFAHNPEPLPEHLAGLADAVQAHQADLGIAVDPDVDRLALICEDGAPFGEEYTLVAIADYFLGHRPGNTVSNLSSSRALRDVTLARGGQYFAAAVGEVHVVRQMKAVQAVIGGEGNGGVIVPDLHYGRDAVAGTALFLSALCASGQSASALRAGLPQYEMVKDRMDIPSDQPYETLLARLLKRFSDQECSTLDGLKVDFPNGWVHLRKSNTEPIIRIYAEAQTAQAARDLAALVKNEALNL